LRNPSASSILDRGKSHTTMLITSNTHTYLIEAATAVLADACWQGFDMKLLPGRSLALVGSCPS
jgi:hypothetical protein